MVEAPAIAQLAQANPDLHVLGLGSQDDLDVAHGFLELTNLAESPITMVWDPSFESWRGFGIRSQPYWILYDAQGNEVTSRPGSVDLGAVQTVLDA